MSELPFRRVVVLCDAACDIRVAVSDAATLAARWGIALHGVFLDDENLRRLAELPFGHQVSLSNPMGAEELTAGDVADLSLALGAGMRRAIAQAASAQGIEWTFGSIRDLPAAAAQVAAEDDFLLVEGAVRAFSGTWRPRSVWEKDPGAFAGTVLVRGQRNGGKDILIVLPKSARGRDKVLLAGAAIAADDVDIIVAGTSAALENSKPAIAAHLNTVQRNRMKPLPVEEESALLRAIGDLNPSIVVLECEDPRAQMLLDLPQARRDILLVR